MNLNLHSTKKENDNNNQNYTPCEITEWDDADMLHKNLLRGIYSYGFEKPSVIQHKAIPVVTSGKDVIAQAQSGTGKTGAFSIGSLNNVDEDIKDTQIIIMSPTRELAKQIFNVAQEIAKYS